MDRHYSISSSKGIYKAGGKQILTIGQVTGCDITVVNHTPYEDEIFAKIVPNREGDGWHLVKLPTHWPVSVNGTEMRRVHYLQDGDVIDFPNASCRFNIIEGERTEPAIVHLHSHSRTVWVISAILAVVAGVLGLWIYDSRRDTITSSMQADIEASLFTTRVDSLLLMRGDSVVERYVYASSPVGTAFLTADSLLVTARHCIQPWLNRVLPFDFASIPAIDESPVKMALFAETENQLTDTTLCRVVSFVTLTDEKGNETSLSSDEFAVNSDEDDIVELGSYSRPMYWRSISHRYTRQSMMLGDIATARFNRAGSIPTASADDIRRLLSRKSVRLTFFGHPESAVNGNTLDRVTDELRVQVNESSELPGHLSMLAHGGALTPGFSGGPVIVRDGIGFKAVGVISVTDEKNVARSYSVPTSEIKVP